MFKPLIHKLLLQLFEEDGVDEVGGGFAAGEFHHLADEEGKSFVFAGFVVGGGGGVGGEDLVDERFDFGGVGEWLEVGVGVYDGGRGEVGVKDHFIGNAFGDFAVDGAGIDEADKLGDMGRGDVEE